MDERILNLIKSGNFTVITWDNGQYSFYEGKQTVDTVSDKDLEAFIEFDCEEDGYMPDAVALLIKALGGNWGSI